MSTDENKALYRRFIEEVINGHNLDRLEAFLRPDIIEHTPGMSSGLAGARQFTVAYFTAFPDLQLAIDDLIAEGDKVVARLTGTGTHRGVFLSISPTGKRVTIASFNM
jgi:predicted ester cyclase